MDGDFAYVIDLLDEALGEAGSRDHTFPWLRDAKGELGAVTAYYPTRALGVVILRESDEVDTLDPELRQQLATMLARKIEPLLLVTGMFAHDEAGALRRTAKADREVIRGVADDIDDDVRRSENHAKLGLIPDSSGDLTGWYSAPTNELDGEEEAWDDAGDYEDIEDDEEPPEPRPTQGWRSRPIALAALGAATMARHAFSSKTTREDPLDLQILIALALIAGNDSGESPPGLAQQLAAAEYDVRAALRRLRDRGLVEDWGIPEDDLEEFRITSPGGEIVQAWIDRVGSLFPAWPPDDHAADDAVGPEPPAH